MGPLDRNEHLDTAKQTALGLIDEGSVVEAVTYFFHEMSRHEELQDHPGLMLGKMLLTGGHLETPDTIRHFIDGFA